ncbi:DNA-directed RNA polymerase specialized sigma24 family protein [Streptomyces sp. SLBN-118]|uniref:RNA polymerase sigma factor n=1 Tax=Streptomyces sp. SLBN-118 TaxID=2768454 RepID=UPI00114F6A74|nr:sigma-70 family RNA polymerase sigma factor [Streptomyces sp. SLBN-118]TQK50945.1 DNA-directed RNA polymerase specialized sigma24 family protein [Streptomyces sp. SLBN-118]
MSESPATLDSDEYARLYSGRQPQLVAYARSLTGNPWVADDLVAEAHFRVWRQLSSGYSVDDVPAYLATTVRNLSDADGDPDRRIAYVELLARVLRQLPERWVKALWLAEAEDHPLDVVGHRVGAGHGATAVLLHRAQEGMRQAFLRAHPGVPDDPGCGRHWKRIPAHVGEAAESPRQAGEMCLHMEDCEDCRARLDLLTCANDRLSALVGPALLVLEKEAPAGTGVSGRGGTGWGRLSSPRMRER